MGKKSKATLAKKATLARRKWMRTDPKDRIGKEPLLPGDKPEKKETPEERAAFIKSSAFLKSYEWSTVRMVAFKRNDGRCECCGRGRLDKVRLCVDHIKPRAKYTALALDINNLQVLCFDCNKGKGNWDETDWRK